MASRASSVMMVGWIDSDGVEDILIKTYRYMFAVFLDVIYGI